MCPPAPERPTFDGSQVEAADGYGASHLRASSNNTLSNDVFRNPQNDDGCPGCIHGVYAAVGSDDNLIAGNNTMVSFWRFRNDEGEAEDRGTDTASTTTSTTARAGDGDVLDGDA